MDDKLSPELENVVLRERVRILTIENVNLRNRVYEAENNPVIY